MLELTTEGEKKIKWKKSNTSSQILWIAVWIFSWANQSSWQCKPFWWEGSQHHQLKGNSRGMVPHWCRHARMFWHQLLLCQSLTLPNKSIDREQLCVPVSDKLGKGSPSAKEDLRVHLEGTTPSHPHLRKSPPLLFSERCWGEREMKEKKTVKAHRLVLETSRKEAVKELN